MKLPSSQFSVSWCGRPARAGVLILFVLFVPFVVTSCTVFREQDGDKKTLLLAMGGNGKIENKMDWDNEKSFTDAADTGRKIFNTATIAGVTKEGISARLENKRLDNAAAASSEQTAAALEQSRINAATEQARINAAE